MFQQQNAVQAMFWEEERNGTFKAGCIFEVVTAVMFGFSIACYLGKKG